MDLSTDHQPNKIKKNKNKDFTYCLSNRWLLSAKFHALHWSTLGKCDRPGFCLGRKLCHCRSLHLCHFCCCGFAWEIGKPSKKFVISHPSPFCLYLKFRLANCEAWDEFTNPQENRLNNMAKECTQSSTNFEASWRFPGLSYILIATEKKKWQCGMSMI